MNWMEIKFAKLLNAHNLDYKTRFNVKKQLKTSVDIKTYAFYLPEFNLLIDINPTLKHTMYHTGLLHPRTVSSSKYYHFDRARFARDTGYLYIAVWQWDNMDAIIEQILLYRDSEVKLDFMSEHGYVSSADTYLSGGNHIYIDASKYLVSFPHRFIVHSNIKLIWGIMKKNCINYYLDGYISQEGKFEFEFGHKNTKQTLREGMVDEGYLPVFNCGYYRVELF